MTHNARCDDVPYRHPTTPTVALPAPQSQQFISATTEGTFVEWELQAGPRVWVSVLGPALLHFVPADVDMSAGFLPRQLVSVCVDAGTTALDLPSSMVFQGFIVRASEEGQGAIVWTSK